MSASSHRQMLTTNDNAAENGGIPKLQFP
jgi:hypothetical protein